MTRCGRGTGHEVDVPWTTVTDLQPDPTHGPHPAVRSLAASAPTVAADRLVAELVPPPHFAGASFESYVPDRAHPSQAAAVERLRRATDAVVGAPG